MENEKRNISLQSMFEKIIKIHDICVLVRIRMTNYGDGLNNFINDAFFVFLQF